MATSCNPPSEHQRWGFKSHLSRFLVGCKTANRADSEPELVDCRGMSCSIPVVETLRRRVHFLFKVNKAKVRQKCGVDAYKAYIIILQLSAFPGTRQLAVTHEAVQRRHFPTACKPFPRLGANKRPCADVVAGLRAEGQWRHSTLWMTSRQSF